MTISPKAALDPAIQGIFDEMLAYMGSEYVSMNCFANQDGHATTTGVSCTDTNNSSWTFTQRQAGPSVGLAPLSATLGPGQTQQFTASAADASGAPIADATFTWSVSGAGGGTVDATGLYTAPATIAAAGTVTVTARLSGGQSWGAVAVQLHP